MHGIAPLKLSIGYRLFLAIWLTIVVAGALGVELVRWRLLDNFAEHRLDTDTHFLDTLAAALEASYRQHGDWSIPHSARPGCATRTSARVPTQPMRSPRLRTWPIASA